MKIVCVGDSLTFGYGVHPSLRWTHLCEQRTGWTVVNDGVNGDTTGGMLTRMQMRLLSKLREDREHPHVLLMGGSNDVFYSGTDTAARANIGAMIHQLFAAGMLPIVGIPLPVDAAHAPAEWGAVVDFLESEIIMKKYRAWLKKYCTAFGVPYVDFCADFLKPDGSVCTELLLDGLHPTPEGHQLMACRLSEHLGRRA